MRILDCTLRDGGYNNNWAFTDLESKIYFENISRLPIDIVEIGYNEQKGNKFYGQYYYCSSEFTQKIKSNYEIDIALMINVKNFEFILWTHVTSPFLNSRKYDNIIESFKNSINDSLITTTNFNEFLWDINSKNVLGVTNGEWPRTQDLGNFKLITSGVFLAKKEQFAIGERIGKNPMLYELNEKESIDVDTRFDFKILKVMLQNNV